MKEHEISYRN